MARVLIGTSGWHYVSWRGPFYPDGLPIKMQLQYYASQLESAELNGVFYRTPTPDAVKSWRDQTGKNFIFTWKASKFITHWKRLSANSANSLELPEDRLSYLGGKAGPVLFQLPPNFRADADRLSTLTAGPDASSRGDRRGATCLCFSTMTRKVPRLSTRSNSSGRCAFRSGGDVPKCPHIGRRGCSGPAIA